MKQENLISNTNFKRHLYFNNYKNSKEYNLAKCNKLLRLIAILEDRVATINNFSIKNILPKKDIEKLNNAKYIIGRLKSYYNKCVLNLKLFENET